jgi:hypothetical protein
MPALPVLHQRGAAFGIAEDHHVGRTQRQASAGGAGGVIDAGEPRHVALGERSEQAIHGVARRLAAGERDEAVLRLSRGCGCEGGGTPVGI